MTTSVIIIGLAVAALILVVVDLAQQHRQILAWAVLLLALAELLARV